MSNFLYLDIETVPTTDPGHIAAIAASITCPGNISKPESIAAWEAEKKPALVKEAVAKTSFNGAYGRIACIGWAWDDGEPQCALDGIAQSEAMTLRYAFEKITEQTPKWAVPTVVGHFVSGFDIRFIWQRAFVLGVRLPHWFPRDPKPWSKDVHDTMAMWCGARDTISLDNLCKALGVPGKDDVTGADVAAMWQRGEFDRISEYCRADIERTRNVHRKMLTAFGEAA